MPTYIYQKEIIDDAIKALGDAFDPALSPEGSRFWTDIRRRLRCIRDGKSSLRKGETINNTLNTRPGHTKEFANTINPESCDQFVAGLNAGFQWVSAGEGSTFWYNISIRVTSMPLCDLVPEFKKHQLAPQGLITP